MFPLLLRLEGRLVVVVGGGSVGRRRALTALEAGARVRLVALQPRPDDFSAVRLDWLQQPYRPEYLEGAVLVLAAAGREVDGQVLADARARGLWASSASDPDAGDFHVPASFRRGPLTVAVGTGGLAPALAGALRRHLEAVVDETHGIWLELLGEVRPWLAAHVAEPERRARIWEELCRPEWLQRLGREGPEETRQRLWQMLSALASGPADPL